MDVSSVQARVRSPFVADAVLMSLFFDDNGYWMPMRMGFAEVLGGLDVCMRMDFGRGCIVAWSCLVLWMFRYRWGGCK